MVRICLQCRRSWFDPWVRKTPGEGNGNPLQYSWLENSMDRGAWWASVHEVAELYMTEWLTHTHTHTHTHTGTRLRHWPSKGRSSDPPLDSGSLFFPRSCTFFFPTESKGLTLMPDLDLFSWTHHALLLFTALSLSLLSRFLASTHPSHQPSGSDPVLRLWSLL